MGIEIYRYRYIDMCLYSSDFNMFIGFLKTLRYDLIQVTWVGKHCSDLMVYGTLPPAFRGIRTHFFIKLSVVSIPVLAAMVTQLSARVI